MDLINFDKKPYSTSFNPFIPSEEYTSHLFFYSFSRSKIDNFETPAVIFASLNV